MKDLQKVEVIWKDAFDGPQGWVSFDSYAPQPCTPTTVGYVVDDLEDGPVITGHLTICSSYFYNDDESLCISNPIHIPNEMVVSLKHVW